MINDKDIAVVFFKYNGAKVLPIYLDSVLAYSTEADVIVVDNASTDESLKILEGYTTCEVIRFKKNYGFAGGYNKALKELGYEYVLLLNSDVRVTPNWLPPLITAIKSDPSLASVMPIIRSDRSPSHYEYAGAAGGFWDRLGYPFCRGRILSTVEKLNPDYTTPLPIYWSSGAAMLVRRAHFVQSGGFDESYFAHQEEIDWCWRVINQGYYHQVIPTSEVYHLGGGTLDYTHPRKTFLNFRNNIYTLIKNKHTGLSSALFARFFLDMVASLTMILRPQQLWAVWKAWIAVFTHFSKYMKIRQGLLHLNENLHPSYKGVVHNRSYLLLNYYFKSKKEFHQL